MKLKVIISFLCCVAPVLLLAETLSPSPSPHASGPVSKEVFVDVKGAKLFCQVMGEGKGKGHPVIVIHGGPGLDQGYLLPQMAELAENHEVIFYDQRASGRSTGDITEDSMQLDTFVEDLDAVRRAFGLKKVTLLGHSWGGFLAMEYACDHPEAVEKLILMSSMAPSSDELSQFITNWLKIMAPIQEELKHIRGSPEFLSGDPETVENYYRLIDRRYCYNPEKANELSLRMSWKAGINSFMINDMVRETVFLKPFDLHDELKELHIPVLIIHGDADPIPFSTAEKTHKTIQGSKFVLLKECGHYPYVEQPKLLFKTLNEFLGSTGNSLGE